MIISHVRNTDGAIQSNEEHSKGVSKLCEKFASEFGFGEWGRVMGLLHDKGKEKKAFQQHIIKESGLNPNEQVEGDYYHAYVGGLIADKLFGDKGGLIENALMGHHRGLYDYSECEEILKKEIPADVDVQRLSANLTIPNFNYQPKDIHHIERMLFSCLVDADWLDTEAFKTPSQAKLRGSNTTMRELSDKLDAYLENLRKSSSQTEVNRIRNYVQEECLKQSSGAKGFYSLTVPTGGGKTLSSVVWAVHHAINNSQKRIIIAIPFTSIIVQTASILKKIFGDNNVLEHHSNVEVQDDKDSEQAQRIKLATENWDYPIVVTTNVQLFESLFSNKTSSCRKLHNIANSVLILDEVQTLPVEFLKPIVDTLDSLNRCFGVSALFTTASQPILSGRIGGEVNGFEGLRGVKEIIPPEARLHDKLRRVQLSIDDTPKSYEEIAENILRFDKVLCIVNTRKDAKEIYDRLPKDGGLNLHLSRMMCPFHIRKTINLIKSALKEDSCRIIRVISTQLIEAGVDIDFPVVFRQQAGLDSILQAAGRCNREGKSRLETTYVFSLGKEHQLPSGFMANANNARLNMNPAINWDWFSQEAMTEYFNQLYSRVESFDKKDMKNFLYDPSHLQFESAADAFKLIDDDSVPIIVNYDDSMNLVLELAENGPSYDLMKRLAQYSVSVRKRDFNDLNKIGIVDELFDGIFCIRQKDFYNDNVGLVTRNIFLEEILIK